MMYTMPLLVLIVFTIADLSMGNCVPNFDVITAIEVIEHVYSPKIFLKEIKKILPDSIKEDLPDSIYY